MKSCCSLIIFILVLTACTNSNKSPQENFESKPNNSVSKSVHEIVYSLYLPTDISGILKNTGTNFNSQLPAAIDFSSLYSEPQQIAIMLGVYGVDLSYIKLMDQTLLAGQYYRTIENLADKLGIPDDIFESSSIQLEKYFNNQDSLSMVIENIYKQTDSYFKSNHLDNLAALTLAGGWIEAMFLGTKILQSDSGNIEIAERLLQQKYSLNSIYTILSNHQESLEIREYILMLKKIRKVYEKVEIMYNKEGFNVDTTEKKIQVSSANFQFSRNTMNELINVIQLVRKQLIKPRNANST